MHSLTRLLAPFSGRLLRRTGRKQRGSLLPALWLLCYWPAAGDAAAWEQAAKVAYLHDDSPVPQQEVTAALAYAIAAWSARVELQLDYTNASVTPGYHAGLIVIRWLDAADAIQGGSDILSVATTRRWLYTASGDIAGAEIFLRRDNNRLRDSACLTHVLLHELGHALGLTHLSAATSVMYPGLESCHHTLTADDVAAAPYPQHICHAELSPGFDIYIPVINIGAQSYSARLQYLQGSWAVTESWLVAPHRECDDAYLDADTLILKKVWTPEHVWQAELENVDDHWHLKYAR